MAPTGSVGLALTPASSSHECGRCRNGLLVHIADGTAQIGFCTCQAGWQARYKLPAVFMGYRCETWPGPASAQNVAASWLSEAGRGANLIIMGPVGIGKTGLAVCAYKRFVDSLAAAELFQENRPTWAFVPDLLESIKLQMGGPDDGAMMALAASARLLVLDDLGVERETDFSVDVITQTLMRRYMACLPTVITTQLSAQELDRRYGRWIVDRLRDRGYIVALSGESRRRRGVKAYVQGV